MINNYFSNFETNFQRLDIGYKVINHVVIVLHLLICIVHHKLQVS